MFAGRHPEVRCSGWSRPAAGTSTTSLALMASKVGVSPDPDHLRGRRPDRPATHPRRAGPDGRARSRTAARHRCAGCIVATGHPAGLLRRAPRRRRSPARPRVRRPRRPAPGSSYESTTRSGRVDRHDPLHRRRRDGQQPRRAQPHPLAATPMRGDAGCPGRRGRGHAGPGRRRPRLGRGGRPGRHHHCRLRRLATTRRCSSARPRARSPSPYRSTTTSRRTCTPR